MTQTDSAVEYTREELIAEVDKASKRTTGMSAAELAFAYRKGKLEMPGRFADLLALLNLLPDNDPLFEGR
jgi:hypothetical protein